MAQQVKIWSYHFCGSSCSWGMGLIHSPGTSACHGCGQKKDGRSLLEMFFCLFVYNYLYIYFLIRQLLNYSTCW